jgi:U32 family peptidase
MKPELCAPAGTIESFHAALSAGADAVYLGLTDFNARLRAKNFTVKTLSWLVPYAHKHKAKLYVTLNTLVKQAELVPVVHTLYQLEQIGIDALIVADRGVIDLARKHFPRLRLHASTQMVVHNSAGARAAARLGLKRAVLSRECTLEEIRRINKTAGIELEVFVHGALCYGVSGLCLASSYLGGSSGNRGRCTQVCRRKFASEAGAGYYFSPNDLCAVSFVPELAGAGVAALKIEGRMKNAAYVYTVVNAYRKVIDGNCTVEEAQTLLADDLGRKKTSFFLGGVRDSGVITAAIRSGVGEIIGSVVEAERDRIVVATEGAGKHTPAAGDRVRIQPASGFEGTAADIRAVSGSAGRLCLTLKAITDCKAGDTVFLVGRRQDAVRFDQRGVEGVEPVPFRSGCPFVNKILPNYSGLKEGESAHETFSPGSPNSLLRSSNRGPHPSKTPVRALASQRDTLWVKTDTVDWLDFLINTPCQRLLFAGSMRELEALLRDEARLKIWRSRLFVALPPFIAEDETGAWRQMLGKCTTAGIIRGVSSNIGHGDIFPKGFEIVADGALGCLNSVSQRALGAAGFRGFVYPYEDDYLNMKACYSPKGTAGLFARVPLFISRIRPAVRPGTEIFDTQENRFFTAEAAGLHYLLPEKSMGLTHRRKKLSAAGIHDFLIDLCFCRPDAEFLAAIVGSYREGTRLPDTGLFNFKAGLK